MAKIKVKFTTYAANMGDGSVRVDIHRTATEAHAAAEADDERMCEDVQSHVLTVDSETGEILGVGRG